MTRRGPLPCKTAGCGMVYTPGYFAEHVRDYHGERLGTLAGLVVEEVEFCGCTNEELEAGRTCGQPQCPNAGGSQ